MEKTVRAILAGEKGAAGGFYHKYERVIRRYLLVKLPSKEDAEEVLQDVFISAFDSMSLFRGESSVKTWLISIARHEVADFYRRRYVRRVVEQTRGLFEEVAAEIETPEFVYRKNAIKKRFEEALGVLSGRHREVLFLRYEMGMSVAEIAERLQIPFKATESLLFRARRAFIAAYNEKGE